VQVAHAREEVVLDLEVETADAPRQQVVAAREVHAGLDLVDRPRAPNNRRVRPGRGNAVSYLKHKAQGETQSQNREPVKNGYRQRGMDQHGEHHAPDEEEDLAPGEDDQLGAPGPSHAKSTDPAQEQHRIVVEPLPLESNQRIQEPEVDVLKAVGETHPLSRREASQGAQIYVVVDAYGVGLRVV